jgi:hypothetical protein
MPMMFPEAVVSTLEEGRQAYVAVPSLNGPHVTPELYSWSGGRLWFAAASTTVKSKVLQRDPSAGALVSVAGRSVVLGGAIEAFDMRDPVSFVRNGRRLPDAARALAGFTVRNAPDLLAFIRDSATGQLGCHLPVRVLFALTPARAAYVENDVVTGCWGEWSGDGSGAHETIPAGGEPAVAAFPGPVALPARWFADQQVLHVPRGLLELLQLENTFKLGIVVDDYCSPGPASKRGTLVRAQGCVVGDDPGFVEVEPEEFVGWVGIETVSTAAD